MKNYTQVYVKNSFEAAEMYCKQLKLKMTLELPMNTVNYL